MTLILPYPPSANRYWRVFRGRAVKSAEATAFQKRAREIAISSGMQPFSGDVSVTIDVYRPAKRGDLDNTIKILGDSLIGIAYIDDKQITQIIARRFDDKKNPRAEVTVNGIEEGETATQALERAKKFVKNALGDTHSRSDISKAEQIVANPDDYAPKLVREAQSLLSDIQSDDIPF